MTVDMKVVIISQVKTKNSDQMMEVITEMKGQLKGIISDIVKELISRIVKNCTTHPLLETHLIASSIFSELFSISCFNDNRITHVHNTCTTEIISIYNSPFFLPLNSYIISRITLCQILFILSFSHY